jgi:hypothetical protein
MVKSSFKFNLLGVNKLFFKERQIEDDNKKYQKSVKKTTFIKCKILIINIFKG